MLWCLRVECIFQNCNISIVSNSLTQTYYSQFPTFSFLPSTKKIQIWNMHILWLFMGKVQYLINLVSNFPNEFILTLTFLPVRCVCISAYSQVTVRGSTNFDVFHPSPTYTAMFSLPLESTANLKASLLFLQGKCLLVIQEKQNVSCGTIFFYLPDGSTANEISWGKKESTWTNTSYHSDIQGNQIKHDCVSKNGKWKDHPQK